MQPEQDAFGQGLYDHYLDQNNTEIVERDDGYIGVSAGPAAYFAAYDDWHSTEQAAIAHAHGRILDVGCGPGRVCLYLQAQDHTVVGIDNSPLAIKTARLRGVADARVLSVTQVSRKALGRFDTIVMFGNNFGLFGNRRRARWLLRRFAAMSTPNGRILAQSRNIYDTEDPGHLTYQEHNRQRGRMPGQIRLRVRYKFLIGPWFDYLMVSPEEMANLVAGTGWRIEKLHEVADDPNYTAVLTKSPNKE